MNKDVTNIKVGDRLVGKGRGEVTAIAIHDAATPPRIFFDYAPEVNRSTAPWESFRLNENVEVSS